MPDVSLLIPLAELLGVTVTELLEGRRIAQTQQMNTGQVENLVKRTIHMSGQEELYRGDRQTRKKHMVWFLLCVVVSGVEIALLSGLGYTTEPLWNNLLFCELFGLIFGVYLFLFIKERLPGYYDENKISVYEDGIFRIHMTGLSFRNSNWPYIVRVMRVWAAGVLTGSPLLYLVGSCFLHRFWHVAGAFVMLTVTLGGLFIPVYVVGKKYE